MPEGPELFLAARYINANCRNRLFDKIVKSDVSKCAPVEFSSIPFTISAVSRGKELAMVLESSPLVASPLVNGVQNDDRRAQQRRKCFIFFHFGMSGSFKMTPPSAIPKHSHLRFFTKDGNDVLNFIDVRRFGGWQTKPGLEWSAERGPDAVQDYDAFRANVLNAVDSDALFQKSLCEVLLNQRYFNGIGNYMRAEIMHRANVEPFSKAYDHLKKLTDKQIDTKLDKDILFLCKKLQQEIVDAELTPYADPSEEGNWSRFREWCQCYMKTGAKSLPDRNGRTVWFIGAPGPLAPKSSKTKILKKVGKKSSSKNVEQSKREVFDAPPASSPPSKKTFAIKITKKRKTEIKEEEEDVSLKKSTATKKKCSKQEGPVAIVSNSTHRMSTRSRTIPNKVV